MSAGIESNKDCEIVYSDAVSGYRAALDNETIAKRMKLAVTLTTVLIIILLILIFPRPLIGLLALLPSSVGDRLPVCLLFFIQIHVSSVRGFGGAIQLAFTTV